MAANHIKINSETEVGRQLTRYARQLVEAVDGLASVEAAMVQMRDGDGISASHYDLLATEAGYAAADYADANTAAKASFDELASLLAKVNSDASVSNVRAAIDQFAAKHAVIS
ncbi:MAG: hypothetical protein AAFZ07_20260 [Actinomycetota bacterium]